MWVDLHGLGLWTYWLEGAGGEVGTRPYFKQGVVTLEAVHRSNLETVSWWDWNKKDKRW